MGFCERGNEHSDSKNVGEFIVLMPLVSRCKVLHSHSCTGVWYKVVVCVYLYIHTVMNTTILQLVAIYNIQVHVSALYVGHHQVVQGTYKPFDA